MRCRAKTFWLCYVAFVSSAWKNAKMHMIHVTNFLCKFFIIGKFVFTVLCVFSLSFLGGWVGGEGAKYLHLFSLWCSTGVYRSWSWWCWWRCLRKTLIVCGPLNVYSKRRRRSWSMRWPPCWHCSLTTAPSTLSTCRTSIGWCQTPCLCVRWDSGWLTSLMGNQPGDRPHWGTIPAGVIDHIGKQSPLGW